MSHDKPNGHHSNNHNQQSRWVLTNGNVDGSRPRILNETVVGPKCSGGNPTAFMGKEDGIHDAPPPPSPPPAPMPLKRRRDSLSSIDADSVEGVKRIKTRHGYYEFDVSNEFSLSSNVHEADESNNGAETASTSTIVNDGSSQKSSVKSVPVNRSRPAQGIELSIFGIGSWAVLPEPIKDEG